MSYENFIGLRYLMSKRRSRVLSIITMISVAGVALGVTAMIVVLSVMGGFKKDLKEKILGTKAHIVVQAEGEGMLMAPEEVLEAADGIEAIEGTSPYVESEVMVSSNRNLNGLLLRGIDPNLFPDISDVPREIIDGRFEFLLDPNRAIDWEDKKGDVPPGSLLEQMEKTRDKIDRAQKELDDAEKKLREEGQLKGGRGAGGVDGSGGGEDSGADGSDESSGMPSITGEENGENDGGGEESGGMPSITGEEDGDGEESGGMPSIAGDDEEQEGSGGRALPGLIIGKELAKSLQVDVGEEVNVVTPQGDMGPTGPLPRSRPFRVVGIFYTGMYEYDANYGYTTLAEARDFLDEEGVTGVEMKTDDVERAMATADLLDAKLDERFDVLDWKELNQSLFYALKLEKIAMFVLLIFIVLVASFSIIAMLIMIVLEKSRDIAVMKSMGMPDGGIMRVFMFQGVVIGGVGAMIGLALGLGICFFLIEYGFPLDSEVYYISTLPVEINAVEVSMVVVCTILISFVATLYPSWKAAQLRPVQGLRYE